MNAERPARLNRDDVLRAALELLNEVGIDALSTRKLAERLGVQSPTLYWHFKSKAALLDAMSAAVMQQSRAIATPGPGEAWQDWLMEDGRSFRKALLACRDGARLHAGTRPGEAQRGSIEARLALLCKAGFEPGPATVLMMSVGRFVVGWVLEEQSAQAPDAPPSSLLAGPDAAQYPLLAQGWKQTVGGDPDELFERALRLLIDGARP
ncbi:TetR/AcrR family tetracycline transcriptional repressor [Pelomonas saccharophila]|uniref:TetR/AcrR family tetracycline transcriptional repressor n=1 Tax=Roseateles saccharophilus TaxID=304 RepID=A0ABU1YMX4_ROSSA|nr:tetracycline resistance transcriptional repressor TetR [Roseateles saccharophilus]MDR7270202.1 TetR/AcrR family tetracycline transcriptional repressor [Roseateles saccharophilus]